MKPPRQSRPAGFTLIELLLVMGIITVLAAGIGGAFQSDGHPLALQSAQGTLVSLLRAARSEAALVGRNAALLASADAGSENYLHDLVVAVRDPTDTSWVLVGDWTILPAGIYALPPATPSGELTAPGVDWGGLRSSAFPPATELVASAPCFVLSITPRGTVSGGGDIVLATAVRRPPGGETPIQFVRPDAVRGVSLSSYGVAMLVNDRAGFQ